MTVLRLCLFWVKSISENAFPYLRVFGCARKIHFPEMLFSWPVNGCKLVSVFILPSNSHFSKNRERAKGEGDAPARKERERERERKKREGTIGSLFDFDFAVRLWIRSTSPFDFAFAPIAIAVAALIRHPRSQTQIRRPRSRSRLRADHDRRRSTDSRSRLHIWQHLLCQLILLFNLFLLLFMGLTALFSTIYRSYVLFQLTFTFIYNFQKKEKKIQF